MEKGIVTSIGMLAAILLTPAQDPPAIGEIIQAIGAEDPIVRESDISPSLKILMICSSVNRFFMAGTPRKHRRPSIESVQFRAADHWSARDRATGSAILSGWFLRS